MWLGSREKILVIFLYSVRVMNVNVSCVIITPVPSGCWCCISYGRWRCGENVIPKSVQSG